MWPTIAAAMEFVVRLQGPQGEIYWCEDTTLGIREDSLITGCSSIYKSFECALNIATILREEVPHWAMARTRLGNAIANHPECFDRTWDSKSRFAMDWFYPVDFFFVSIYSHLPIREINPSFFIYSPTPFLNMLLS